MVISLHTCNLNIYFAFFFRHSLVLTITVQALPLENLIAWCINVAIVTSEKKF